MSSIFFFVQIGNDSTLHLSLKVRVSDLGEMGVMNVNDGREERRV